MAEETKRPLAIVAMANGERWRVMEQLGAILMAREETLDGMVLLTAYEDDDAPNTNVAVKGANIEIVYEITDQRWEIDQQVAEERRKAMEEMERAGRLGASLPPPGVGL